MAKYTANLKNAIKSTIGLSLTVALDDNSTSGKEILVGNTNRQASKDALAYLKSQTDKDSYLIQINDDSIVLLGTTEMATVRAVKLFIENYVNVSSKGNVLNLSAGKLTAGIYNTENIIYASNGIEFESEILSTVYQVPENGYDGSLTPDKLAVSNISYPSIIKLAHQKNEADNGKLICVFYLDASHVSGAQIQTKSCVMMSEDDGLGWKCIARPEEEIDISLKAGQMAHIYELPKQVGDMPAGTLIYAANSVDFSRKSDISIWRSYDCGYTWEQYVRIASGGGNRKGVWEPFTICSEEDGENWENAVEVVTCDDPTARAGMPVITKMGNGEYFMVFELVNNFRGGAWDSPIYCKTTKDLSNWGDASDYGALIEVNGKYRASAPTCAWLSAGGECGVLIVTAKNNGPEFVAEQNEMFVSFDYGKTWESIENPLSYDIPPVKDDRIGYSPAFWVDTEEKSLYYVNCVNSSYDKTIRRIAFSKIKIY